MDKKPEGETLDQSIQGAVDKAMEKWQKEAGMTTKQKGESSGDSNLTTQAVGSTLMPELLAVLLQGAGVQNW